MGREIIDISKWNSNINYDLAAQNAGLVIARVQYGTNKIDELYGKHVNEFEKRGVPHAAYAYGCFISVADAKVEAQDFLKRVNPRAKFLVLDVEDDTVDAMRSAGNLADIAKASQAFIDVLKAAGWRVGFYVSHHMYGSYNLQSVKADFYWIPRYSTSAPNYYCDLWQYADGATGGTFPGVGLCDRNRLMNGRTLEWFIGGQVEVSGGATGESQSAGIGVAVSKYPVGYGVNLYNAPDGHFTGEAIKDKTPYLILSGAWYGGDKNMLCLGHEQWVPQEHVEVKWFMAYSRYRVGYGVNTYDAPNGNFTGNVDGSKPYDIWERRDGYILIEAGKWVQEKHFVIK